MASLRRRMSCTSWARKRVLIAITSSLRALASNASRTHSRPVGQPDRDASHGSGRVAVPRTRSPCGRRGTRRHRARHAARMASASRPSPEIREATRTCTPRTVGRHTTRTLVGASPSDRRRARARPGRSGTRRPPATAARGGAPRPCTASRADRPDGCAPPAPAAHRARSAGWDRRRQFRTARRRPSSPRRERVRAPWGLGAADPSEQQRDHVVSSAASGRAPRPRPALLEVVLVLDGQLVQAVLLGLLAAEDARDQRHQHGGAEDDDDDARRPTIPHS